MNNTLNNELKKLENQLAELTPREMPADMLQRLESTMASTQRQQHKIISIPNCAPTQNNNQPHANSSKLHSWGAAAAIALLLAITAVFMSNSNQETQTTAKTPETQNLITSSAVPMEDRLADNFKPQFTRNIIHASYEGITYPSDKNKSPSKVIRIEYTEKVITKDKNGNRIITENSCVDRLISPVLIR